MKAQDLKNSILQLAIQGKLVAQDEHDEPAEVLYAKIQAEKQKLIKEGKIKKDKPLSPITEDEIPFPIPPTWKWVRLGEITTILGGKRIPAGKKLTNKNTGHKYIRVSDMKNGGVLTSNLLYVPEDVYPEISRYIIKKEDVYITVAGTIGRVGKIPDELDGANLTENADRLVFSLLDQDCLIFFLCSNAIQGQILELTTKVGQPKLAIKNIEEILFPLPPLEEQKRIVAKIEELEPLINQYDQAEQELSTLNDKFPEQLKKSILQYAIQGRLVSQDENNEPAEVLYAKIQAEKQKLIKEGKIKKDKPLPPITEDEIPFPIPPTWKWVRLGEIVKYIQRGKSPEYTDIKKVPVISQKCNQWNGLDIASVKFITERSLYNYNQERYLLTDDLLLNSTGTGTVGRVGIYYENLNPYHIAVADSHVTVVRPLWVSSKYLYNFFASPYIQLNIENLCDGSTNQIELALQTVKKILIPLPPLEEQHRIVARVDELLQACDKLIR